MIREDSRADSRLLSCHGRSFPSLGTDIVVTGTVPGDTLQYPIPTYKVHLLAVLDSVRQHGLRIEAIVEIEHVACITAQECSCQCNGLLTSRGQGPEGISLSRGSSL